MDTSYKTVTDLICKHTLVFNTVGYNYRQNQHFQPMNCATKNTKLCYLVQIYTMPMSWVFINKLMALGPESQKIM
jgi:hypothetical protein